jgi:septum formation protein
MTLPKDASPIATNSRLCLASASPRRLALLEQINLIPARMIAADIDETPEIGETPKQLALRLAQAKAATVSALLAEENDTSTYILAADTVVSVGRRILPKAETEAEARACLALLSGRGHRVRTGFCVRHGDTVISRCVSSRVQMKTLSPEDIENYLASEEWRGKAGGYAIQGLAGGFIMGLVGSYSNIVGLPLYEISAVLQGIGFKR